MSESLPSGWRDWPPEAKAELIARLREAERRKAQREQLQLPPGSPGETALLLDTMSVQRAHLRKIDEALVAIHERQLRFVMINTPPQVGKSQRVSKWFPFWWLSLHPRDRLMNVSYAQGLAGRNARQTRALVEAHGWRYGMRLNPSARSGSRWELTTGGGMLAVGVGGGITGEPADGVVIDDPHKNRAEAESPAHRERVLDTWSSAIVPRMSPTAFVLIVLTRWHPDDLQGHLLREEGRVEEGGKWTVLNMAAIAAPERRDLKTGRLMVGPDPLGRAVGEPLSHPKIPEQARGALLDHWEGQRAAMSARDNAALNQGDPRPAEGVLFHREPLDRWRLRASSMGWTGQDGTVVALPAWLTVREYVDPSFADADSKDADETGRLVCAKARDPRDGRVKAWVLADMSERAPYDRLVDGGHIGDTHASHGTTKVRVEQNLLGNRVVKTLREQLPASVEVSGIKAKGTKALRAETASPFVDNGLVVLVGEFPELEDQLLNWSPTDSDSPDRLDAFVHAVLDLLAGEKPDEGGTRFRAPQGQLAGVR